MVTLEFSCDTPCLAAVIPAMDKMHAELTAAANNNEYSPALRAALSLGKSLLNKYYSLTDDSEVYRIAIGMYNFICLLYNDDRNITSSPPETQTKILQEAGMGGTVD